MAAGARVESSGEENIKRKALAAEISGMAAARRNGENQ